MKILVVTGSSGGHLFPCLAFLEGLGEKYPKTEILLLLPAAAKNIFPADYKIPAKYFAFSTLKIKGFLQCALQSLGALLKFKPDIVVGFGSLATVPAVFFAWLMRITTVIHEQNVLPGRATRFLAKFCDRVAISFAESRNYLGISQKRIILTGNPLRKNLACCPISKQEARSYFGLAADKFTVLVMGGSQASHNINLRFLNTACAISIKEKLQVIHLCGPKDYAFLNAGYQKSGLNVSLHAFLGPMQFAYSAADLVICRAGASTVSEITRFSLPAILIPYPYAYRHQQLNAKALEEKGAALILEDNDLGTAKLKELLEKFISNPQELSRMRESYAVFPKNDATDLLIEAVCAKN